MFDRNGNDNSTYNVNNYEFIKKHSPVVGGLLEKEYNRQKNNVELIASENYCSEAILAACGSLLSWTQYRPERAEPPSTGADRGEADRSQPSLYLLQP